MRIGGKSSSDYPFYAGTPVAISARGWLLLMGSVALAFAVLSLMPLTSLPALLLTAALFAGLPLATLAIPAGRYWKVLFQPVGLREIGIILVTAIGAMLASGFAAMIVSQLTTVTANPIASAIQSMSAGEYVRRLIPTAPQLLGEELLTLLPFLAILWVMTQRLGANRHLATVTALMGSSALFAAAHLPTYHWHFAQCFGVIGAARLVLTLSYIWTRNLWVPVGAYILTDWTEFTLAFGLGHVPINAA